MIKELLELPPEILQHILSYIDGCTVYIDGKYYVFK